MVPFTGAASASRSPTSAPEENKQSSNPAKDDGAGKCFCGSASRSSLAAMTLLVSAVAVYCSLLLQQTRLGGTGESRNGGKLQWLMCMGCRRTQGWVAVAAARVLAPAPVHYLGLDKYMGSRCRHLLRACTQRSDFSRTQTGCLSAESLLVSNTCAAHTPYSLR